MAAYIRQKPASWFWVLSLLLVAWGLAGCAALYFHIAYGPRIDPAATDWDRAYYAALPGWFTPVYAIAVLGGLFGAVALVLRSKLAVLLFVASLVGVVVQFGYVFAGTDMLAHKGPLVTIPFPLFIAAVAAFEIWFAVQARRRGWIS